MRECFCFGSEAVNASGEGVRGWASRARNMAAPPSLARSRIPPATHATFRFVYFCHAFLVNKISMKFARTDITISIFFNQSINFNLNSHKH